jgi:hypothetical protein
VRSLLLILLLGLITPAQAQFGKSVGGSTAQFLRLGAGARALGMGDAYGPIAEGPNAMYWNPAGLAQVSRPEIAYSHVELLRFFHHDYIAYAHPVALLRGTLAIAGTVFYQDSLPLVTNTNKRIGDFGGHSEVISIGYGSATQIGERFATRDRGYFEDFYHIEGADLPLYHNDEVWEGNLLFGGAFKFIQETLHTNSARAFAFDGGVLFRHSQLPQASWSFAIKNIGTRARFIREYESLPAQIDMGVAFDARLGRRGDHRLLPAFEIALPYYGRPYGKIGVEYTFPISLENSAAVRFGYKSASAPDLNPLTGLTGGIGMRVRRVTVDFGFQPMAELGEVYRIGLGYRF